MRGAERTAELRKLVDLLAGREVRMAELKEVIRRLRAQLEGAMSLIPRSQVKARTAEFVAKNLELEAEIADRQQAEAALRTSESFLNGIIEQGPYAMWISDEKGTLIRLNQACRDLLNIEDEDVVGKYNVLEDNIVAEQGFMPLVESVFAKGKHVVILTMHDSAEYQAEAKARGANGYVAKSEFGTQLLSLIYDLYDKLPGEQSST